MAESRKPDLRIGVDSGGTFTDFVIHSGGQLTVRKVPSTPADPSEAILQGLADFLSANLTLIIHGTTVGTNALLEKKGGRLAFITTAGFEDIIFIGRQTRKHLYSLKGEERSHIISPRLCFGLEERIQAGGRVEKPLRKKDLDRIIETLKKERVEAVAVCLLHSYANPAHEQVVAEKLRQAGFKVSSSSSLLPEYREYERASTTVINAYLLPVMDRYLGELQGKLKGAQLKIMQSNEGYISADKARQEPIKTILSGPTGGVVGALHLARAAGFRKVISFDMGGTSTDVSLIDGRIKRSTENLVGDFPVRLPMVDVHSVGAGGGSVVYVDKGGLLRVGPQSVGANPGPACYGQGDIPSVTDANLCLGRLDPEFFLGGRMKIYPERSQRALETVAKKIGRSLIETALGVVAIANASMEKAIRVISVERGYDPRQFSLVSFGGAGGLHAVEMAKHLMIPRVIIPRFAGVLSALGLLLADSVKDYSRSFIRLAQKTDPQELERVFEEMTGQALAEMAEDGFDPDDLLVERQLDLRYLGQSHELTIPYRPGAFHNFSYLNEFHRQHRRLFSYYHQHRPVEIVNLRVRAVASARKIRLKSCESCPEVPSSARIKKQWLYYGKEKYRVEVIDRSRLLAGNRLTGPVLIVDAESTTFVPPGYVATTDRFLNLIIEKAGRA
ncbi:MAG: hydantoinase/oxoprolinase family protein [Candidatus Saccharicenans sp.]|nr:hydantoinase/oxoprolinase family protein [Candidatus Saccharicenans sp.]MDH7576089.1 hydantoinase/oxoprolinase family protein [Candidatus Saccharicenans sp.]